MPGHRKYPLGSADAGTRAQGMEIMEKAIELARAGHAPVEGRLLFF